MRSCYASEQMDWVNGSCLTKNGILYMNSKNFGMNICCYYL